MHNQLQNSSSSNYDKLCMKMFGGSGRFTDKDKYLSPAAGHLLQDSFTVPQNAGARSSPTDNRISCPRRSKQTEGTPTPPSQSAGGQDLTSKTNRILDVTETELDNEEETIVEDPILILDIKLVKDEPQKITVYEYDNPEDIVEQFCQKHSLDDLKKQRLLTVIKAQIQEYYAEQQEDGTTSRDITGDNNTEHDPMDERNSSNAAEDGAADSQKMQDASFTGAGQEQPEFGSPDGDDTLN